MSRVSHADEADYINGFSRRRMAELFGLLLFGFAAFVALSLLSYNAGDPSFNVATDSQAANMAGTAGAYFANPTLQTLGLASVLLVIVPLAWGWRLFKSMRLTHLWLRASTLMASLVLGASLLAFIEPPVSWPIENGMGGAIGDIVKHAALNYFYGPAYVVLALMLLVPAVPYTVGLYLKEWGAIGRGLFLCAEKTYALVLFLFRAPRADVDEDEEVTEREPFWKRIWPFRSRGDDYEEEEEDEEQSPRRAKAKKVSRREARDIVDIPVQAKRERLRQPSLELKQPKGKYQIPSVDMLSEVSKKAKKNVLSETALAQNARLLETVLKDFGVNGEIVKVRPGPVVTLYELEPSPGTRSSRVVGLCDDIARSMSAVSARIATLPGKNAIGIELPNSTRETVLIRELFEDNEYNTNAFKLPLALGKDISGAPIIVDLERMPHLLVAGTTGSGKSVAINTMIMSLIYRLTPDQCKFIMIDPKMLELSVYDDIPHLLAPVVTEPGKAVVALKWTVKEMENRYRLMSSLGVRNIDGYNKRLLEAKAKGDKLTRTVQTGFDPETGKPIYEEQALDTNPLPYIVVVVDEMADLMLVAGKEIESSVQRLAQMARAAGIHIIMATQRPSVDVITGVIKANFPTRISFQVTSRIDSRTILGEQGAEQLLGQGDMLYMAGGGRITRVHGPFISDKEVEEIVKHLREQGSPSYVDAVTEDPEETDMLDGMGGEGGDADDELYRQALSIVTRDRKASTSYVQRHLKIGYNRAARLIDRMEKEGIVGPANHVGKREVIMR